ncbi:hypothetical protein [Mycobacterium sp. 236(2023)]|uniref:hypothetical protein n=1 Tax=Mycobacterium sp. 236(2023) TaxID=3038163 RepID=UPI0024153506|nr:hypothetical protein [Mycobacterium sp. 236(2023)]MDG4668658.1 hypothetical protein [Mycobacterium sp. 236(2023)]
MAKLIDPVRDRLVEELRAIRRMPDVPTVERLSGQSELIEALGMGDLQRAWARLERLREENGADPKSDIGAFFYLAGWGIGGYSLDQRKSQYANDFHCDERTALRRGDRGADKLATIIRDRAETNRPWGFVSVFQSGDTVDFIVRLMMAYESWRPAEIRLNGDDVSEPVFTLRPNPDVTGGYYYELVADGVQLDTGPEGQEVMASIVVHWPMPVWPTWQTMTRIADPRVWVRTRTFRDRGIEVWLEWYDGSKRRGPDSSRSATSGLRGLDAGTDRLVDEPEC